MTNQELLEIALCCNRCGTCRGVVQDAIPEVSFATQCPCGMTLHGSYEPSGLMYMARGLAQGDLKWNEDLAKALYACTICGYCDDFCQRGYRHTPCVTILEELRRRVPERLKPQNMKKAAETLKIPTTQKLAALTEYGVTDIDGNKKAATVLFGDPVIMSNTPKLKEIGHILQKSGKKVGCFMSAPLPPVSTALINGGCEKELARAVDEIDRRLAEHGVKTVYVYHPESLSVLKRFCSGTVEFLSIIRLYASMLKTKKARKIKLPVVTYQDPCHLGRYAHEYAAPREVIKRLGLQLKEMWRTGHDALCCGAGGGVISDNPSLAARYASNRWNEAKATGAKVMITACPFCNANLRKGKPKDIKVMDLTSLVAQAYGYRGKEVGK